MADTGQHTAVTAPDNARNGAATTERDALASIVEDVLRSRGIPAPLAAPMAHDVQDLIKTAAKTVPSWVIYAGLLFGGPGLGALYTTAKSVWGLPERVAAIEQTQADQGKVLDEIKALLTGPTSKPKER